MILLLCGCEEVFRNTPQILKGRAVIWLLHPTHTHDAVESFWAVIRPWHSVALIQMLDHFWVTHPWKEMVWSEILGSTISSQIMDV